MSKSKKPKDFIKIPRYPGGSDAMKDFLTKNLEYPKDALDNDIEGSVSISFKINGLGNVFDVIVKKSLGYGCDEEAVRIVSLLSFEKAINRGLITTTNKTITINFKLPKKTTSKTYLNTYNYTIVPSKPELKIVPKPKKTYTISINYNQN
jgi:TonB family protein